MERHHYLEYSLGIISVCKKSRDMCATLFYSSEIIPEVQCKILRKNEAKLVKKKGVWNGCCLQTV